MPITYDRRQLNQFIIEYFNDEELRILCAVEFRGVYDDFSDGWGKKRKVLELIGWCERNAQQEKLLTVLQRERPRPFRTVFGQTTAQAEVVTVPVGERNPRQIFISHAHQDAELAQRLAADLRAHGWQTWFAPDSIQPGEQWVEAINRGLEESGIFLVLLTPDAVSSKWVKRETNVALGLEHEGELAFYPLDVKPCRPPALWRAYQFISFKNKYQTDLAHLLWQLSRENSGFQFFSNKDTNEENIEKLELKPQSGSIKPIVDEITSSTVKPLILDEIEGVWKILLFRAGDKIWNLPLLLNMGKPLAIEGNTLVIGFDYPLFKDKFDNDVEAISLVGNILTELIGQEVSVRGVFTSDYIIPAVGEINKLAAEPFTLHEVQNVWFDLVTRSGNKIQNLPALLNMGKPIAVEGDVLVIGFDYPLFKDKFDNLAGAIPLVGNILTDLLGQDIVVRGVVTSEYIVSPLTLNEVKRVWAELVARSGYRIKNLPALLNMGEPIAVEGRTLVIGFDYPLFKDKFNKLVAIPVISEILTELLGKDTTVRSVVTSEYIAPTLP